METTLLGSREFDYVREEQQFRLVFDLALEKLGDTAFLRYRGNQPIGSLPPAYFEAISIGIVNVSDEIKDKSPEKLRAAITALVQSSAFRDVTGPGANSREKLEKRIDLATEALRVA